MQPTISNEVMGWSNIGCRGRTEYAVQHRIVASSAAITWSKIGGDQIVRTPASANIDLGSGGTYQITVGIKRVQKARHQDGHLVECASVRLRVRKTMLPSRYRAPKIARHAEFDHMNGCDLETLSRGL